MIMRVDRLPIELPRPDSPNPNAASAVQELMGGKFGEMSTLMNYTFQSFNFRGKKKYRPFYDLLCNIAAEEHSHIELVAGTINLLLTGATKRSDRRAASETDGKDPAPLEGMLDMRNHYHFLASAQCALPVDSMGRPWTGANVFSSGNLKLDLLHNFFLECGARANKMRVYDMVSDPTARAMVGFLLVRGGVHIVAYAKALEKLTGVDVGKLLPIPDVSNRKYPEARIHEDRGLHRVLFDFSRGDYEQAGQIWNGPHPEDGGELEFRQGEMPEGFEWPDLDEEPQLSSPGIDPDMLAFFASKLGSDAKESMAERKAREADAEAGSRPTEKPARGGEKKMPKERENGRASGKRR